MAVPQECAPHFSGQLLSLAAGAACACPSQSARGCSSIYGKQMSLGAPTAARLVNGLVLRFQVRLQGKP